MLPETLDAGGGSTGSPRTDSEVRAASSTLTLSSAYLYGAAVADVRWEPAGLSIDVHYDERLPGFYDLEQQLNLRAATLVFDDLLDRTARLPGRAARRMGTAADFAQRWEASDEAWTLVSVAPLDEGGYVVEVRQAGEFYFAAAGCTLNDVVPFEPDPRYAEPLQVRNEAIKQWEEWQNKMYVDGYYTGGRIPPYLLGKRPNKFGYFLLAGAAAQAGGYILILGWPGGGILSPLSPWRIIWLGFIAAQLLAGFSLIRPRH